MHLHVISFDIPFPANYGGVIDVYYKLVWLHKLGLKIHLHCFEYGRAHSKELEAVCEKVSYYHRNTDLMSHISLLPYNVKSRTIYWEIGPLEQGKVALTEIGLVLKPSLGQVDQKPTLTSTIVLDAEDALTKMKVKTTLSPLTTSLYNEEWPQNPAIVTK